MPCCKAQQANGPQVRQPRRHGRGGRHDRVHPARRSGRAAQRVPRTCRHREGVRHTGPHQLRRPDPERRAVGGSAGGDRRRAETRRRPRGCRGRDDHAGAAERRSRTASTGARPGHRMLSGDQGSQPPEREGVLRLLSPAAHRGESDGEPPDGLAKGLIKIVQIGDVPGRLEPGTGEINYPYLFKELRRLKYSAYLDTEMGTSSTPEHAMAVARRMSEEN